MNHNHGEPFSGVRLHPHSGVATLTYVAEGTNHMSMHPSAAAHGASIILNASIVASKGLPEWSVYSATKAAVRSFARTWTTDLKDRRIRVNAVSPGFTDTPAWHVTEVAEQRLKMASHGIPLGRSGTPEEIAKAVVFLASDDSRYITGTELFVDGGFAQV
jgi:NAD(P)-dependent dehydrogenase (short-subunit alcohol dehydrogenase family)